MIGTLPFAAKNAGAAETGIGRPRKRTQTPPYDAQVPERPPLAAPVEDVQDAGQAVAQSEQRTARKPRDDAQGERDADPLERHQQLVLQLSRLTRHFIKHRDTEAQSYKPPLCVSVSLCLTARSRR